MTTPWPASATPYITPDQLTNGAWPVAVDWTTLPPGTNVTAAQKTAALAEVCLAATSSVNGELNFPIHAVLNTEQTQGPDYYVTVNRSTGEGRVILSRWPVTQIVSVQVAAAGVYPIQWTTVPAGFWRPWRPVIGRYNSNTPGGSGEGSQAILIAPNYINWCRGRNGVVVQVQYYHGWPHTHLTSAVASGATSLPVADITAWGPFAAGQPGAEGIVYDATGAAGSGQEGITVTAATPTSGTSPTGPGTLTLASALSYNHNVNLAVSALPSDVIWASVLFAAAEALTRGAQSTTVQSMPGRAGGVSGKDAMKDHACKILHRFTRVI